MVLVALLCAWLVASCGAALLLGAVLARRDGSAPPEKVIFVALPAAQPDQMEQSLR